MNISIHGKNIELTPAIKKYAENKIGSLVKFLADSDLLEARIEVGIPSKHHKSGSIFYAEVNFNIAGRLLRAKSENYELYAAIDEVRRELETQIRKFKDKKNSAARRAKN